MNDESAENSLDFSKTILNKITIAFLYSFDLIYNIYPFIAI